MPEYVGAFRTAAGRESRGGRPALSPAPASAAWRRFRDRKTAPFAFRLGFFWLGLGLALEAFEGGIKKDYATFSYFFVTSGLASFVLIAAGIAMRRLNVRFSALVKCGQNPMVAYTAAGFLIMPLLTLLHLAPYLQTFAEL